MAHLSVRGWQRAGALAVLFGGACWRSSDLVLPRPSELVAASDSGRSERPRDTLRPLSELLGVPIGTMASTGDLRPAAGRIAARAGVVLVCWPHRELPVLARALLPRAAHRVPALWDEACFDLVWVMQAGDLTVQRVQQAMRKFLDCLE